MTDRYLWGKVGRISPEAPVPIVEIEREENRPGGAANVGLNLLAMGAQVSLCGITGDDQAGKKLRKLLRNQGFDISSLFISHNRKTTLKTRVIGNGQQMLRVDKEDVYELSEIETEPILLHLLPLIPDFDAIILQDYDKGFFTDEMIMAIISKANDSKVITCVDPKYRHFFAFEGCTLFKPNLRELADRMNHKTEDLNLDSLPSLLSELKSQLDYQYGMLTLSSEGMLIHDSDDNFIHIPAHKRQVADVSGAGDTVISIAALGLAVGLSFQQAATYANLAGGLVCESVGVVPVDKKRLMEEAD